MINRAIIRERKDGKYDFDIVDAANGNILCSSSQGYENQSDCLATATRILFADGDPTITFTENYNPEVP